MHTWNASNRACPSRWSAIENAIISFQLVRSVLLSSPVARDALMTMCMLTYDGAAYDVVICMLPYDGAAYDVDLQVSCKCFLPAGW